MQLQASSHDVQDDGHQADGESLAVDVGVDFGVDQAVLNVAQQSNQDTSDNSQSDNAETSQASADTDHGSVSGDDADVMPGAHAGEDQGNSSQTEQDQVVASQGEA